MTTRVDGFPAAAFSWTVGRTGTWEPGRELPAGWHRLYLREAVAPSELGVDGAQAGASGRPPDLPVRVHGGTSWEFVRPIRIGDVLDWTSVPGTAERKDARSGPIAVAVDTTLISADGETAVIERNVSIYKPLGQPLSIRMPDAPFAAPDDYDEVWRLALSDIDLFRFAALTFNAHRVHLDRQWATKVEPYPDLLVQGPLLALLLMEAIAREGIAVSAVDIRNRGPAFAGETLVLSRARDDANEMIMRTEDGRAIARAHWN